MATGYRKLTQYEKNAKKFGTPKFKNGDKVKTFITDDDILTIQGEAWSNGHSWMYYFEENEYGIGQQYITKHNS